MQIQRLNKKFELELIIITNSKTIDTQPHQHWQYKIIINTEKQNSYAAAEIKKWGKKNGSSTQQPVSYSSATTSYKHHKKVTSKVLHEITVNSLSVSFLAIGLGTTYRVLCLLNW